MEELLKHFIAHIHNNISTDLSKQIIQIINQTHSNTYEEIELSIKRCIKSNMRTITNKQQYDIAKKLYNSFIQMDDNNIIKSIMLFYRYYSFYHHMRLKSSLCKWRIKAFKLRFVNQLPSSYSYNNNDNFLSNNNKFKGKINTIPIKNNNFNKQLNNTKKVMKQQHLHDDTLPELKHTIQAYNNSHNRLYLDHHQRTYHRNFANELQDVTRVAQCTFTPNSDSNNDL